MAALDRFITAQQSGSTYKQAYRELENGSKTSHWIWYIFPQLQGFGSSPNAIKYAIKDLQEACDYLQDKTLFTNYQKITLLVSEQLKKGIHIETLMGSSIDASKLASSMTLFSKTAAYLAQKGTNDHDYASLALLCDGILKKIKIQGYYPCQKTIQRINTQIAQVAPHEPMHIFPIESPKKSTVVKHREAAPLTQQLFFTPKEPTRATNPVRFVKPHDYSALSTALGDYVNTRKQEWSYHYNFLGFVALVYLIQDAVMGTDHFNSKNREIKLSATQKLKKLVDHPEKKDSIVFSNSEKKALLDGRLGQTVTNHGGIDSILKTIAKDQEQAKYNNSPG